jgi:hypothetical protein
MLYQPACHTAPNWEMSTLGDQGIATLSEIVAFTLHVLRCARVDFVSDFRDTAVNSFHEKAGECQVCFSFL